MIVFIRVSNHLENLEMSGNFDAKIKSQGIFCCAKFIFSQSEHPNVETFPGEHALRPSLTVLGTHRNLIVVWKSQGKSGNFILSGEWTPCPMFRVELSWDIRDFPSTLFLW